MQFQLVRPLMPGSARGVDGGPRHPGIAGSPEMPRLRPLEVYQLLAEPGPFQELVHRQSTRTSDDGHGAVAAVWLSGGLRNYKPLPPKCLCFLGLRVPRSFVRRPLATGELSARFRHL